MLKKKKAPTHAKKAPEKRKASNSSLLDGKENAIDLDNDDNDFPKPSLPKQAMGKTNGSRAAAHSSKQKADRRKQLDESSDEDMFEQPAPKARSKPARRPKCESAKCKVYDLAESDEDDYDDEDAIVD